MRDKIIEVLKKHEGFVDRSRTACCIWSDDYSDIAEEIEKLYENHIKTGTIECLPGAQAIVNAGMQLVNDFTPPKEYDKSKFKIFPTWKETKEVSEISEEVFLGFIDENRGCNGFLFEYDFKTHCNKIPCHECILDSENTKADIIKWMEETK